MTLSEQTLNGQRIDESWDGDDRRLLGQLRERAFAGPMYEAFEVELVAFALPTVLRWIRTGEIFKRCQRIGLPVDVDGQFAWGNWIHHDHSELAKWTIAHALRRLREDLLRSSSPTVNAATFSSLFLTVCLREFPEQLQALVDHKLGSKAGMTNSQPEDSSSEEMRLLDRGLANGDYSQREEFTGLESIADEDLRTVARLIDAGKWTYAEAAAEMGISPATLSERLRSRQVRALRTATGRPA
ncbi:hypothetical protein ACFY36_12925 [Actinoplanes sp. NPDC000266]